MHPLKPPSPDGLSGCFYKTHWPTIGDQLVDIVREFFSQWKFVKGLNKTFIALIPKNENSTSVDQFRPISLCNFAYKIVSKLLAKRLCSILLELITPFQAAFVSERRIAKSSVLP